MPSCVGVWDESTDQCRHPRSDVEHPILVHAMFMSGPRHCSTKFTCGPGELRHCSFSDDHDADLGTTRQNSGPPEEEERGEEKRIKASVNPPADTIFALPNGWRHHPWTTTETIDHRDRSPSPTTT